MFSLRLILAAGSLSTLISGAPVPSFPSDVTPVTSIHLSQQQRRSAGNYITTFGGSGDVADGWPSENQWISSFETMFNDNNVILKSSCTQWNVPNNSDDEISALSASIQSVAASSGVDARFIFAIIMQESNGCVRVPTTNNGVRNPGLMQDHNGAGTCNDASVSNPCPTSQITQMIEDGVDGTAYGDGLKQVIAQAGGSDASTFYKAARLYNSGSIDPSGNLGAGGSTHCYASDIANRLIGWSAGPSSCNPGTVGTLTTTVGSIPDSGSSSGSSGPEPAPTASSSPAPAPTPTTPTTPATPSAPSADEPGGAFVEVSGAKEAAQPASTPPLSPSSSPAPVTTPTASDPVAPAPAAESTVVVSPTPAASTPAPQSPAPETDSAVTPTPGAMTGPCTTEGFWNCVGGNSFQQCASGTWSVVQSLAAGMKCTVGQSKVFGVSAVASKQKRRRSIKVGK